MGLRTGRGVTIPQVKRRSQSDDLSRQWAERFRKESPEPARTERRDDRPAIHAVADL